MTVLEGIVDRCRQEGCTCDPPRVELLDGLTVVVHRHACPLLGGHELLMSSWEPD